VTGRIILPKRGPRRLRNVVVGAARVTRTSLWQGAVHNARDAWFWFVRWPIVCGWMVGPSISFVPA